MAQKIIPAKTIINCDICNVECDNSNRKVSGVVIVKQHILDYGNVPCANGDVSLDLCDACLVNVGSAINQLIKKENPNANI